MPDLPVPTIIVFALFPDLNPLDFVGPHQVFCRLADAEIVLASAAGGTLQTEDGLSLGGPDPAGLVRLADVARCDVLCTVGGDGVSAALRDPGFMAEVRRLGLSARYVTSVCTGSLILGGAGLLEGRRAACHWAWRDLLEICGAVPDPGRVVRDGPILTGGGVTAGIDFALTLAAELRGDPTAQAIQLMIEYAPAPPFEAARPETAPPEVVQSVAAAQAQRRPDREQALAAAVARWKRT